MKAKDIKEYEEIDSCFGSIIRVNGEDYEDLSKESVKEFIMDMIDNDLNKESLMEEIFKLCLENLQFYPEEVTEGSRCESCGHWGTHYKYIRE